MIKKKSSNTKEIESQLETSAAADDKQRRGGVYNLWFMWAGIVGAAFTLFSNFEALVGVSDAARFLVEHYLFIIFTFWDYVFQALSLELDTFFALPLTYVFFIYSMAFSARFLSVDRPRFWYLIRRHVYWMVLCIAASIFLYFAISIISYNSILTWRSIRGEAQTKLADDTIANILFYSGVVAALYISTMPIGVFFREMDKSSAWIALAALVFNIIALLMLFSKLIFAIIFPSEEVKAAMVQMYEASGLAVATIDLSDAEIDQMIAIVPIFATFLIALLSAVVLTPPILLASPSAIVRRYLYVFVVLIFVLFLNEASKLFEFFFERLEEVRN